MERFSIFILGFFLLVLAGSAWADGTVESTLKTGGIMGLGASEVTTVHRYKGDKMWASTATKFTGAILSRIVGGSEDVTVTRVDKGVYCNIDSKNRSYTETPIEA